MIIGEIMKNAMSILLITVFILVLISNSVFSKEILNRLNLKKERSQQLHKVSLFGANGMFIYLVLKKDSEYQLQLLL